MTAIDQKTYLQKYLSGPTTSDKKKKKKKNVKGKGFKIIDDDLDLTKLRPLDGDELDILNDGEDAPQIAGIIDERPDELKRLDDFQTSSKWRVINQDDGFNSKLKIEEFKRDRKEVEKENEIVFGKMYSDSEDEKKNDSDLSPPRDNKNKNKSSSQKKKNKHSDSDFSPPRKKTSELEHTRNDSKNYERSNKSDSDASPPRKKRPDDSKRKYEGDYSHQRDSKEESSKNISGTAKYNSDASPPRRKDSSKKAKESYDSDPSPPRKNENKPKDKIRKASRWGDFKDDEFKSRQRSKSPQSSSRHDNQRYSNERNATSYRKNVQSGTSKTYHNSDPSRKSRRDSHNRRQASDSDESPPRKRKHSSEKQTYDKNNYKNNVPSKRNQQTYYSEQSRKPSLERNYRKRNESESDPHTERSKKYDRRNNEKANHKKRYNDSDSDLSPIRRGEKINNERRNYRREIDEPPPTNKKMERTLEGKKAGLQDAKQLKQENEAFRRKEDEAFKNMTDEMSGRNAKAVSRKSKRETSEDRQKQKEKAERQKELDEKYKKWSKGLKQVESQQAAVEDFIHEASKPLARYKGDRDLESRLMDVERDGDPMLKYMREKKREKGELGPEKPTYKGNFAPNRFNIRPGYRWDGVDRSNGYEKKFFEQQSKKKAQEEEVYKWSTEDL